MRLDQWLDTYILKDIFDPSLVVVADAQTKILQNRHHGLVAVFCTAKGSDGRLRKGGREGKEEADVARRSLRGRS